MNVPVSNVGRLELVSATYNPASVAANTTADNGTTVTVTGVCVADRVIPFKPTTTAGLSVDGATVTAVDTITVAFTNHTGSPIDPGSETWTFLIIRSFGTLPSSVS